MYKYNTCFYTFIFIFNFNNILKNLVGSELLAIPGVISFMHHILQGSEFLTDTLRRDFA
ncbi:hypothetical protein HanRHA438_Chr16g0756561 [Helianthus annuus]|nr:hypothetical protein HanRHA438_Chr16g0756561 [Helianthus annuus]